VIFVVALDFQDGSTDCIEDIALVVGMSLFL
jgi:hypothetical protein